MKIAQGKFCESTIGTKDTKVGELFRDLFQTETFRTAIVLNEISTIEMCGALKNVVALGAGFVDGLELGNNTKAAVIRIGLVEMIQFIKLYEPDSKLTTFLESSGIADLMTTCYGGRNRSTAEAYAKSYPSKTLGELEEELLNGQKLQGPETAQILTSILESKGLGDEFPMFVAIDLICNGKLHPNEFLSPHSISRL